MAPYLLLSLVLVAGLFASAWAQTDSGIVINEIETNPPGDDTKGIIEWIELYNPTDTPVDLTGWTVSSSVLKKTLNIPYGTVIEPDQLRIYLNTNSWFSNVNDSVELYDEQGIIIDKTPLLSDAGDNSNSWQRIYDGYDTDGIDDWKFVKSTAGSSNGRLAEIIESDTATITLSSDKDSYTFGESAILLGTVSEQIFVQQPYFQAEPILMTISGPNYYDTLTLYPDSGLKYSTSLTLNQVLGFTEGTFDVSVSYAGVTADTLFTLGFPQAQDITTVESTIAITTDKLRYIPGEFVTLTGTSSDIIPFEGMTFNVTDIDDNLVSEGTLFPVDGKFQTKFFLTIIDPSLGQNTVNAQYGTSSTSHTFEVQTTIREDVPISLNTDKSVYGAGDLVTITGSLNDDWTHSLDLKIIQTSSDVAGDPGFRILDGVQVQGDGTFDYSFMIPNNDARYGDYKITISGSVGEISRVIPVVPDPENFVASDDSITIRIDKQAYEFGDTIQITGTLKDHLDRPRYLPGTPVEISIVYQNGTTLEVIALQTHDNDDVGSSIRYDFTALPDSSGRYSLSLDVSKHIFTAADYIIKAKYLDDVASTSFTIFDLLDLKDGAVISTDKQVYGLGETVTLSGRLPPVGVHGIDILLIKPNGAQSSFGASLDNQRFTWSWDIPAVERSHNINDDIQGTASPDFGIYKIIVSTDSSSYTSFFKVSADPENDSLYKESVFVTTAKSLYKPGQKLHVDGNILAEERGNQGASVPIFVLVEVLDKTFPHPKIHEASIFPDQNGDFSTILDLPATIFTPGEYIVRALYGSSSVRTTFVVADHPIHDVSLELSTDKMQYDIDETVTITGKISQLAYFETFDLSLSKLDGTCNLCDSAVLIRPDIMGSFTFAIPLLGYDAGTYEVTVDAGIATQSTQFMIELSPPISRTIIDKVNGVTESVIPILTETRDINDVTASPRAVSGSLITADRDDLANVNLRVSTVSGICILGTSDDCLVRESTRAPGKIFDVVELDGIHYNVRYSGPDVRVEKFSIVPESPDVYLPDSYWNVEVAKDDQLSKFYYKVTYKTIT